MWNYNYELYHHGIKGMHWGDRNGPPYPLEDKQLSSSERRVKIKIKNNTDSSAGSTLSGVSKSLLDASNQVGRFSKNHRSKQDLSGYSDAELQQMVKRMDLERRYRDLAPDDIRRGANNTREILEMAGAAAGLAASAVTIYTILRKVKQ